MQIQKNIKKKENSNQCQNTGASVTYPINKLVIALLIAVLLEVGDANLICNSGFDNFTLSTNYTQNWGFARSNNTCWFAKGVSYFQVKNKIQPPVGNVVELVSDKNYTLCQYVVLKEGTFYQLSFNVVNSIQMYWSIIYVYINKTMIVSHKTINPKNTSFRSQKYQSSWNNSIICFNSTFSKKNTISTQLDGPSIDNVTVVQVGINQNNDNQSAIINNTISNDTDNNLTVNNYQNTTLNGSLTNVKYLISVYCTLNELQTYYDVVLRCSHEIDEIKDYISFIQQSMLIQIQGERIQNYYIVVQNDFTLRIVIVPDKILILNKIIFRIVQNQNNKQFLQRYQIIFYVNGQKKTFLMLQESEVATLKSIEPVVAYLSKAIKNCFTSLRTTFFSFFIIDLISFWNLTLMYNFLSIEIVPSFSKNFLENLISVLFKFGSIIEWMKKRFPVLQESLDFSQTAGREQMQQLFQNSSWFGVFGFSSGFFNNNTQQIISFFLLIMKILLVKMLKLLLKSCFQVKNLFLPKDRKLLSIFLLQLLGCTIFLNISASTCILDVGLASPKQKVNLLIQVLCLLFCVLIIPLFFIAEVRLKDSEIKQIKQQMEAGSSKKNIFSLLMKKKKSKILRVFNDVLNYIPYFTVTFLIVVRSVLLFLLVNSVVLLARVVFFLKYKKRIKLSTREIIFLTLNLLIWSVHHSTYVLFFILSKIYSDSYSFSSEAEKIRIVAILKIGGFITIFTVLLGGFMQTANLLFEMLHKLLGVIKFLKKKFMQKPNQQINAEEKKKQKNYNRQLKRQKKQNFKLTNIQYYKHIADLKQSQKLKVTKKMMQKLKQISIKCSNSSKKQSQIKTSKDTKLKGSINIVVISKYSKKRQQSSQFNEQDFTDKVSRVFKQKNKNNLTFINNINYYKK